MTATNAPVDPDPLPAAKLTREREEAQQFPGSHDKSFSSEFSLALRPDIGSDEHLPPIHETPWTADGKTWYDAKISVVPHTPGAKTAGAKMMATNMPAAGEGQNNQFSCFGTVSGGGGGGGEGRGGGPGWGGINDSDARLPPGGTVGGRNHSKEALQGAGGLSITLRPEGGRQRRRRFEREATVAMCLEDERSRVVGEVIAGLGREAAARARVLEGSRESAARARVLEGSRESARLAAAIPALSVSIFISTMREITSVRRSPGPNDI